MSLARQELTNRGIEYLRDAQLGATFRVDHIVVGSGAAVNLPDDLYDREELFQHRLDVPIAKAESIDERTILVNGAFSNLQNNTGVEWRWNELGIVVVDDAGNEILYTISNTGNPNAGDIIPLPDAPGIVTKAPEIQIRVDRVQNIAINIQPAGIYEATNRGLPAVGPGPYIEKVGDVLHFRRFVQGEGIELLGAQDTITISQRRRIIDVDLTLFVYQVPNPANPLTEFPNLPAALRYAQTLQIPSDKFITIQHGPGVWTYNEPIEIYHPQARQIRILGALSNKFITSGEVGNPTAAGGGNGGPYNYRRTLQLTPAEAALVNVNDGLTIFGRAGGTPPGTGYLYTWDCASFCDGKDQGAANRITFVNHMYTAHTSGGRHFVTHFPTVLNFPNSSGLIIKNCQLGLLNDFLIRGARAPVGQVADREAIKCDVLSSVILGPQMGIYGFGIGLSAREPGSVITGERTFVHGCVGYSGVFAQKGGVIDLRYAIVGSTNNDAIGAHDPGSSILLDTCYVIFGARSGILASDAHVYAEECTCVLCVTGVDVLHEGNIVIQNSMVLENDLDYRAHLHSTINCVDFRSTTGSGGGGFPSFDPMFNVAPSNASPYYQSYIYGGRATPAAIGAARPVIPNPW